jgi:hypothetical protein
MRHEVAQNCPLCGTGAVYYFVDYQERKYFKCPSCTYFQITVRGEDRLRGAPQQWRDQLADQAKNTPPDHLLVISVPPPTQEGGRTTEALTGEYLPKKELPL